MGGSVSGLEAVSVDRPGRRSVLMSQILDRSALTWAPVKGPPHLAAWQLSVLSVVISILLNGAASTVTVLYLGPQFLDAALNFLSHHHSVTPTFDCMVTAQLHSVAFTQCRLN
jgi:hypothetical protein